MASHYPCFRPHLIAEAKIGLWGILKSAETIGAPCEGADGHTHIEDSY